MVSKDYPSLSELHDQELHRHSESRSIGHYLFRRQPHQYPRLILEEIERYRIAPHDLRRTCAKLCRAAGGELEQIQLLLGHASVQTTERYLGTRHDLVNAPNDAIKLGVAI